MVHQRNPCEHLKKCKVLLYCNTYGDNISLLIHAADKSFGDIFGHIPSFDNNLLCLNDLIGPTTSTAKLNEIQASMELGISSNFCLDLYHSDGFVKLCFITLTSITGNQHIQIPAGTNQVENATVEFTAKEYISELSVIGVSGNRWGVLTIQI